MTLLDPFCRVWTFRPGYNGVWDGCYMWSIPSLWSILSLSAGYDIYPCFKGILEQNCPKSTRKGPKSDEKRSKSD